MLNISVVLRVVVAIANTFMTTRAVWDLMQGLPRLMSSPPRGGKPSSPGKDSEGPRNLEGFGDASYEEGYAQTGVLVKFLGMTITWKSCTTSPSAPEHRGSGSDGNGLQRPVP